MAQPDNRPLIAANIATFALLGALCACAVLWMRVPDLGKTPPLDPVVTEHLNQARGLQKLGKWAEAGEIIERYAHQGYPRALFHHAKILARGWGVEPDLEKARLALLRTVQFKFSLRGEAAYELGLLYQRASGPDCGRIAVEWFLKALDWSYEKAHVQLAKHFSRGIGVDQDLARAALHYDSAAKAGFEAVSLKFARLLVKGANGIEKDPERALVLAESAIASLKVKARSGSASSAKTLGRLYRDGEFVRRSTDKAFYWLRHASHLGNPGAMHDLANLLLAGKRPEKAAPEAIGWLKRAAEASHGGAMTKLGRLHLAEKFGLKNTGAVAWFERGVEAAHAGAMEELARICAEGKLAPKNMDGALKLAMRGSKLGHTGSKTLLKELLAQSAKTESARS
ncbi:MAG: tetratricopeptide repeat protein [Pseudomonadota bacterium]